MERPIKQEPVFEEDGDDDGGQSATLTLYPVKGEPQDVSIYPKGPDGPRFGSSHIEYRIKLKDEDQLASDSLEAPASGGREIEESLSDEGIGGSPDTSEYIVQSNSEEEARSSPEGRVERQIFDCEKCGMAFTSQAHLLRHMKIHTFNCQYCNKQFASDLELLAHEDVHRESEIHCCDACNILFDSKEELEEHYGDHIYACSICPKTFTESRLLLEHEKDHIDLSCHDCGKIFSRSSNLKVHKEKFCRKKKPSSEIEIKENTSGGTNFFESGERDKSDDDLLVNEKAISPKRGYDCYFHCSDCPKSFQSTEDFERHRLLHQQPFESSGFECKDCETTYPSLKALQNHFLKHIYPCKQCDKSFTNKKKMLRHLRQHNKVFQCKKCQKSFKRQYYLKVHMEKAHKDTKTDTAHPQSPSSTEMELNNPGPPKATSKNNTSISMMKSAALDNMDLRQPELAKATAKNSVSISMMKSAALDNIDLRQPELAKVTPKNSISIPLMKSAALDNMDLRQPELAQATPKNSISIPLMKNAASEEIANPSNDSKPVEGKVVDNSVKSEGFPEKNVEDPVPARFNCTICSKTFPRKYHLDRHIKTRNHELRLKLKCKPAIVRVSPHEKRHGTEKCEQSKETVCSRCQKEFTTIGHLKIHMKWKHGISSKKTIATSKEAVKQEPQKPFKCRVCAKTFAKEFNYNRHRRLLHHKLRKGHLKPASNFKTAYICRGCSKMFSSKYGISVHMKLDKHETSTFFQCGICYSELGERRYLMDHLRRVHPGITVVKVPVPAAEKKPLDAKFHCKQCPQTFASQSGLYKHVRRNHLRTSKSENSPNGSTKGVDTGEPLVTYKCFICLSSYNSKSSLLRHFSEKHPGSTIQLSSNCNFSFTDYQQAKGSVEGINEWLPNIYKCLICSKSYESKHGLLKHFSDKHPGSTTELLSTGKSSSKAYQLLKSTVGLKDTDRELLKIHKCFICSNSYESKHSLKKHMRLKHPESTTQLSLSSNLKCKISQEMKTSFEGTGTGGPSKTYKCFICSKSYYTKHSLLRHFKLKHPSSVALLSSSGKWRCKFCLKVFARKQYLLRHTRLKHPGLRNAAPTKLVHQTRPKTATTDTSKSESVKKSQGAVFACTICPRTFEYQHSLALHMTVGKHIQMNKQELDASSSLILKGHANTFRCGVCQKSFSNKGNVWRHFEDKHQVRRSSSSSNFNCEKCLKTFGRQYELNVHMKLKHQNASKEFQCQLCPKVFAQKRYLTKHVKRNHTQNEEAGTFRNVTNKQSLSTFSCDRCPEKFSRRFDLYRHLRVKHKVDNPYQCSKCSYSYSRPSALARHVTEKHPQCQVCSKVFDGKLYLIAHMKFKHPGSVCPAEDYCPKCGKLFPSTPSLRKHIKYVHKVPFSESRGNMKTKTESKNQRGRQDRKKFATKTDFEETAVKNLDEKLSETAMQDTYYRCKKCPMVFLSRKLLYQHMNRGNHTGPCFKCPECPVTFFKKEYLRKHVHSAHSGASDDTSLKDPQPKVTSGKQSVDDKTVHGKIGTESSTRTSSSKAPMKPGCLDESHIGDGEEPLSGGSASVKLFHCSFCPRTYLKKAYLAKHVESKHQNKNVSERDNENDEVESVQSTSNYVYKCSVCPRSYTKKVYLEKHMASKHPKSDRSSENKKKLQIIEGRNASKSNKISVHGMALSTKTDTSEMAWKCSECGKQFASKPDLKRHEDTHVFMCNYCNRFFTKQKSLEDHDCVHQKSSVKSQPSASKSVKPSKNTKVSLKCELCSKVFRSSEALDKHQEEHTLTDYEDDAAPSEEPVSDDQVSDDAVSDDQVSDDPVSEDLICDDQVSDDPVSNEPAPKPPVSVKPDASTKPQPVKKAKNALPDRILVCRFCDKIFTSLDLVHNHERSHWS